MLITISEAAAVLGLKSRGSVYRKVRNGELKTVAGPDGVEMLEREGLEDRWGKITRTRGDSPRPAREAKPLRPVAARRAKAPVIDEPPESVFVARVTDDELPEYNESRKRSEYERANLLELDRKQKEGLLLPAEQVAKVWANSVTIAKTKLLAVPSRLRQRIPHLTLEEVAITEDLIREALEELAGHDE